MNKFIILIFIITMFYSCSTKKYPNLQGDWYSMVLDKKNKKHTGQLYLKFTGINESGNHLYEGLSSTSQSNWICEFDKKTLQCTYKKLNNYGKIILHYSDKNKDLTGKWTYNNKSSGFFKAIKRVSKGGA